MSVMWYDDYLEPRVREELFAYRENARMRGDGDAYFAREYANNLSSSDFQESLDGCETIEQRAQEFADAEIASYPFYLELPGSLFEGV